MKKEGRVRATSGVLLPVGIASDLRFLATCLFLTLLFPLLAQAQNIINTVVGGGDPTGGGNPLAASLENPYFVVKDATGNTYVSSIDGDYVFKVDINNKITVLAGTGYSGYGITSASAPATSAAMTSPAGLALDGLGNLYITDGIGGHHVFKVNLTTGILTNFAGSASAANPISGFGGFGGDGGPATQALLNIPTGVAFFGGNVYIADSGNNRIRVVDSKGNISTFAGNGARCAAPPACGDNGPATQANLSSPQSVSVDSLGNVFIADTFDNEIREVSSGTIVTVAGNGVACSNPTGTCGDGSPATLANLTTPPSLFVDSTGDLYIVDEGDQKIREVITDGGVISTLAGNGSFGFEGDVFLATQTSLDNPTAVFVDAGGNILIADSGSNRIRVIEAGVGILNTIVGSGTGGDGGPALSAVMGVSYGLALDASNNQFIVENAANRIREVTASTQIITTVAGNGTAGFSGDGGPAVSAALNFPEGVAVDRTNGNLFIADTLTDVIRTVQGGVINTFAGIPFFPCSPSNSPCGDSGMAVEANLNQPGGVVLGSGTLAGDVIIADTGDHRIRRVDSNGNISTVAGTGLTCAAPTAPCGDGGAATLAQLFFPTGVAVDSAGDIFIADAADNRIRRVDATTQIITTVAFTGNATFSGDGGPATLASMTSPAQVFVDASGNLFIGSNFNEVIRRVDAATGTIASVAGNAAQPLVYGFAGDGGPATSATLNPFGVAVSSTGTLFITDIGNNRIRSVQLAPTATPTPAKLDFGNQMVGVASSPQQVTLTNSGGDDLLISSIADANGFSQTNNCPLAPKPLAPAQSCTINIIFTGTAPGAATDTLIITDNAPGSPHNIPLAAVGTAPFQLSTNCTSLTVVPGQTAIYTVALAPAQGFTQSVSLSCSGVPALATCSMSPSKITLDGATTIQATATVKTTPATSGRLRSPASRDDSNRLAELIGLAGMIGLGGMVILPGSRRAKQARKLWAVLFGLCMISTMATISSCGGGGAGTDPPGTAAGTYPLTVTATFQSGSGTAFTEKVSFDLVVQ